MRRCWVGLVGWGREVGKEVVEAIIRRERRQVRGKLQRVGRSFIKRGTERMVKWLD
jgi:hypothetical protein